jgi:hypothetical protein
MPTTDQLADRIVLIEERLAPIETRQDKLVNRFKWLMRFLHGMASNGILPKSAAKQLKRGKDEVEDDLGSSS